MGKGRGDKACLRVITPKCSEKVRKQQQVVSWIDEVEKRTTSVIDVHDRFIIGASNKDGGWGGELIALNADKKNLDSSYQYI
jgi:hypothetical protein